ncbi:MAG TPA: hypothetical protein VF677_09360 [Flavobacterium sp.]|jgi:hypothetical protein
MKNYLSIVLFATILIYEDYTSNKNPIRDSITAFKPKDSLKYKQLKGVFYTDKSGNYLNKNNIRLEEVRMTFMKPKYIMIALSL